MPRWACACMIVSTVRSVGSSVRAGVVVVEEIGVQVEGVDQVELGHIDQVDAHRPRAVDRDRVLHIMEGDRVDRVDLVGGVEGGVEGVHHHDELLPLLRLGMVGVPRSWPHRPCLAGSGLTM